MPCHARLTCCALLCLAAGFASCLPGALGATPTSGPSAVRAAGAVSLAPATLARWADAPPRALSAGADPARPVNVMHLMFDSSASRGAFAAPGVTVFAAHGAFADVFVDAHPDALAGISAARGLVWGEEAVSGLSAPPPRPFPNPEAPRDPPEQIARGGVDGLTGRGVVVAVLDTGIDFRHPDFVTRDASGKPRSRVRYYWDTQSDLYAQGIGAPAPVRYPNGAPVGTVFSRDDLTAELAGAQPRIPAWDFDGHGTATAGIAAGNGSASGGKHAGVAPGADLVVVNLSARVPNAETGGTELVMQGGYLLGAVLDWLDSVARDEPAVVIAGWGAQTGGRDGASAFERQIDARLAGRPGRVLCLDAGNQGAEPLHAGGEVGGADAPARLEWDAPLGGAFTLYVGVPSDSDLNLAPDANARIASADSFIHPISGDAVVELRVASGRGALTLTTASGARARWDAYATGPDARFLPSCATAERQVAWPATAESALAVGSYDFNHRLEHQGRVVPVKTVLGAPLRVGAASAFTNPGPRRRDGLVKPDVLAPGQWHTAPAPLNVDVWMRDSTGQYGAVAGASAALPYAAGVAALALEKSPRLTGEQLRALVAKAATRDGATGETPNPTWGYGKLDLAAVRRLLAAVPDARP